MSQNQNWPPSSGNIGNDFGLCQLLYSNGLHGQDPVSQLASYIHRHKTCEGRGPTAADRAAGLRHRLAAGGPSVYFNTGCLLTVQALSSTHLRRTKHILGTEGLLWQRYFCELHNHKSLFWRTLGISTVADLQWSLQSCLVFWQWLHLVCIFYKRWPVRDSYYA